MGNVTSCAPSRISSSGAVKVLFSDGRFEVYTKPVKAAELMLENPGQFVCESSTLKVGHRIQGLLADEELELRRQFYFLLPMELLYSVLTLEEMSSLSYRSSKALKHGGFNNLGKIFPVLGEFCMFPSEAKTLNGDQDTDHHDLQQEPVLQRYSKQRSWKPALETIAETPCRQS
ncbi:hypothetical protein F2P56_013280 [Juglans regia]|uniref:Uncharacterized protein n=2 Tax=Juglans regia TaxID=51240 RepID=A0A833XJM5_JUGRE|nr:uncharacterized protein LOC108994880 [Juglans regia]KAF5469187.1 hypothetical protein F2P56_013280 [Juglans regia]